MKALDIFTEEQNKFFAKQRDYEDKHSIEDEDGNLIERAIMPNKGYNFSMSYDALESAMKVYAKLQIEKDRERVETTSYEYFSGEVTAYQLHQDTPIILD